MDNQVARNAKTYTIRAVHDGGYIMEIKAEHTSNAAMPSAIPHVLAFETKWNLTSFMIKNGMLDVGSIKYYAKSELDLQEREAQATQDSAKEGLFLDAYDPTTDRIRTTRKPETP